MSSPLGALVGGAASSLGSSLSRLYLPRDLLDTMAYVQPCQIGRYIFAVNPWEFDATEARNQYTQPTKAGAGRNSYGPLPTPYIISGFLANGGAEELRHMQEFRPYKLKEVPYQFDFPFFGVVGVSLYIDSFRRFSTQDMPNYIKYTIQAQSLPPSRPAYVSW